MLATNDAGALLRRSALRATRPRVAVLEAVHQHPHADTQSLVDHVRVGLGDVSQQAVYDCLPASSRTPG